MNDHQLHQHRLRVAELSVGASAVRGMPRGTVAAARNALKRTRLTAIPIAERERFRSWLDQQTRRVSAALPEPSWGVARKLLNIFLRSCVYDTALRTGYGLAPVEPWLEVPLDQQVAAGIRSCSGENLPRFANKRLERSVSVEYQEVARRLAQRAGTHRIHLESCWWRVEVGRCRCAG